MLTNGTVTLKERTLLIETAQEIGPGLREKAARAQIISLENACRAGRRRTNNLKQIMLAAFNNADANVTGLIENICDDKGKPLLSWRVRLLPYMEQQELYNQFKLDEPWDSENNKKLIAKMPKIYAVAHRKEVKDGMTFYQAFVGKEGCRGQAAASKKGDRKG